MKRTLFLISLWTASLAGVLRAGELPWETDYDQALATAAAERKPLLVDFSASWCGPCRLMENTTFADEKVRSDLEGYILVRVDLDQNATLAGKYGVQAIPACFLVNQFGERVANRVGYIAPAAFRSWLTDGHGAAFASVSKNQAALDRVRNLGRALELPDAQARDRAVTGLLDTYCARETDDDGEGAKLAEQALRGWVQGQPALAATSLNEHRLAVRILFARLFAEKLGADFHFDPWAPSDVRAAATAAWVEKLGTPRGSPTVDER